MFRYRRMEITCYILYVKGKAKKLNAIMIFVDCKSIFFLGNTVCGK